MLVKIALTKICAIKTVACAADMCMAWQWEHGHGSEYDENVVWYGDNLYPLPALPPDNSAEDREMIEMLRNCHSIIRSNIVRDWAPPTPPALPCKSSGSACRPRAASAKSSCKPGAPVCSL